MGFAAWNSWLSQNQYHVTLESPKEPIRRKALDPGKFRPRVRARAVWEYARLRQLCRSAYVCVREQSCRKLPFCPVLLSVPRKNMKQRASKHCFHTEGRGSQANFWISWETNASERFLPIMSSPSMVVINLFGMKWVVLSQRVTASPGNLLLHLQLCLCPRLDAGKLLVVLTLNFCHCAWPFHRLSSELSLDCLLLQSSKISTQHVHDDVLSSPLLSLHGCCLHNPSACSALTKCWCSPAIPLSARSLHCVWLGPPVTLVLLFGVVDLGCGVLGAIESVQVFCSGQKKGQS